MKLLTKITLFSALSKLLIVGLFVMLIPFLMQKIAFKNTDDNLKNQKTKSLHEIENNGLDYYFQGGKDYGSYTMLKDEYISIEAADTFSIKDQLISSKRYFADGDVIDYRILRHWFSISNKNYLLEIGKKISAIEKEAKDLQQIAFFVLLILILLTLISSFIYTKYLLSPFNKIINTKILNRQFPFKQTPPVKTGTKDFQYLDSAISDLTQQINYAFEKEREFTSNASHELMTPISIMQTKMENMMSEEGLADEQYIRLEELMQTLNRLKKIVHSLLLISRIDNEQFVRNDTINPEVILKEIAEELSHRFWKKELSIDIQVLKNIELKKVNRDLIFQLFYNLINNAIRYNNPGGAIIITDDLKPEKSYTLHIKDTGIGIHSENIEDIFNRFKKDNQSSKEGIGLGLSIVKSIIQYHHSEIKVQSELGKGSSFTVIFYEEHL